MNNRYNYNELKEKALENPTQENLLNLIEWFEEWGLQFWNGDCYDMDGRELYPIYTDGELTGAEIR